MLDKGVIALGSFGVNTGFGAQLRKFRRSEQGVSMVEFAIVASPFFLLLIGIIELGLIFWASYELEDATASAARLVRTGQAQSQGLDVNALKASLCGKVIILSSCQSKVQISVQSFSSFGGIKNPDAVVNKAVNTNFEFSPGGPGDIVLVNAYYEWPLLNPLTSAVLGNLGDGNRLLSTAAAFRNEPFQAK